MFKIVNIFLTLMNLQTDPILFLKITDWFN